MSEQATEQTHDPVTALAVEMGFDPEYDGENKKTAEEFIRHGAKIQRSQSEKIKDLLGRVDGIATEFNKMQDNFNQTLTAQQEKHRQDLERQREDIESQMMTAVDEADTDRFKRLQKDLKDIDNQASKIVPKQNTNSAQEAFNKWIADKTWIKDGTPEAKELMKAVTAWRIDNGHPTDKIVDPEKELAYAEQHLKKLYPEKFGLKPKEDPGGATVGEGKNKGGAERSLKLSELSDSERKEYDKWKRIIGKSFNGEQFLKNIALARKA